MSDESAAPQRARKLSSRSKDTIIGAIATVLAAVIGAAGVVIASARRDSHELRVSLAKTQADLRAKSQEADRLVSQIAEMRKKMVPKPPDDPGGVSDPAQETSSLTDAPVVETQRERDIAFGLQGCSRTGTVTDCYFKITNKGVERRLELLANPNKTYTTRVFDGAGKQHRATDADVAGEKGESPTVELPQEVSVPAIVRFRTIPAQTTSLGVFDIVFQASDSYQEFKVTFRDVSIVGAQ